MPVKRISKVRIVAEVPGILLARAEKKTATYLSKLGEQGKKLGNSPL